MEGVKGWKAFDKGLKCRKKQFKIGKIYTFDKKIRMWNYD